jgi:TonB family protein
MKNIFYVAILLATNLLWAQNKHDKKIFLDSLELETTEDKHKYTRIIKDYYLERESYKTIDYYKSGIVKAERTYTDKKMTKLKGTAYYYFEDGKIDQEYTPAQDGDSISKSIFYYGSGGIESEMLTNDLNKKGKITCYYPNGSKKEIQEFDYERSPKKWFVRTIQFWDTQNTQQVVNGNGYYLVDNEDEKISGNVKNGDRIGEWIEFDKKEQIKEVEYYDNDGNFVTGTRTEKDGSEVVYTEIESDAKPKNGFQHFYNHIGKNFKFTPEAIKNKINGKIILEFIIETNGQLKQLKITSGLGYGLDEEAIRVVSSYENWIPARQNGKAVRSRFSVPIAVNLK